MYSRNLKNGKEIFPHELLLIFTTAIFVRYYKNNNANSESYINELNTQKINLTNFVKNSTEAMCNMAGFENVSFTKPDPLGNGKKSLSRRKESKRILNDIKKLLDQNRESLQFNEGWKSFLNQCISMLDNEIFNLQKSSKNENLIECLNSVKSMYRSIIFLTSVWNIKSDCDDALMKNIGVVKLKIMLYILSEHLKIYCADSDPMASKSSRYVMNIIGMKDGNRENSIKRVIIEMRDFSQKFIFLLNNKAETEQCFKEIEELYKILAGTFFNETGKWLFRGDGELIRKYNIQEFNNGCLSSDKEMSKNNNSIERAFFCISYTLASNKIPKILSNHLLQFDSGFSDFLSKDEKSIVALMNDRNNFISKEKNSNKYDETENKEREEDYADDNDSNQENFVLLYKENPPSTMYAKKKYRASSFDDIIEDDKNDDDIKQKKRSASLPLKSTEKTSEIVESDIPDKIVNESMINSIQ